MAIPDTPPRSAGSASQEVVAAAVQASGRTGPCLDLLRGLWRPTTGEARSHGQGRRPGAGQPRYRSIYALIRQAILEQRIVAGTRLPSTRDLGLGLGVSRNTVLLAFEALIAEGYLEARPGSGTYVAAGVAGAAANSPPGGPAGRRGAPAPAGRSSGLSRRGRELAAFQGGRQFEILPLCGGEPDFSHFAFKQWQRLLSRHLRQGGARLLDNANDGGWLPLRQAIADYLRVARAVRVSVDQVIVTAGTQHSLSLCAQLLADAGDRVWIEDPGYWGARCAFLAAGLKLEGVPVDDEGLNPALAPSAAALSSAEAGPRLVYLTPSNQSPMGVAMSLPRRRQVLALASKHHSWILEDDYDSEFRYGSRPLAALQGMDTEQRVLYLGTFSKVLYPGIKLGYVVVPAALIDPFRSALYDLQRPGQLQVQAALADFIERGYFTTHVRRLRQAYAERHNLLVAALQAALTGERRISSQPAGLHLVIRLGGGEDDAALAGEAARRGLTVRALSSFFLGARPQPGLVVGFGYAPVGRLMSAAAGLGRLLSALP